MGLTSSVIDTTIVTNFYSMHHNEEMWGDPEVFRPERFLDDEGSFVDNAKEVSFGLGIVLWKIWFRTSWLWGFCMQVVGSV